MRRMATRILCAAFTAFFLMGSAYANTISAQRAEDLSLPVGPPCNVATNPEPCGFVNQPFGTGNFIVTVQGWFATLILHTTLTLTPGTTSCTGTGNVCNIVGTLSYQSTCRSTAGLGPVHCPTPAVVFTANINGTMTQGPTSGISGAGSQFFIEAALSNCGPAPIRCGAGAELSFAFANSGPNLRGLGGITTGALPPDANPGNGGNGDDNGGNGVIIDPGGDEETPVPEPSALQGLLPGMGVLGLVAIKRRKLNLGT